jgi:GAF domain-containing protein
MFDADSTRRVDPRSWAADQEDELVDSLAGLARLATGRLALEPLLTRVAQYAVQAIPRADGVGLTLLEEGRVRTIVTTADFVAGVDAVQYRLGQGPCITAARDGVSVLSRSLSGDPRWPELGRRVARLGVHSALSLPLHTVDGVVGTLNAYAHARGAFDERAVELGETFAAPAAVAVQNAQVLEQARRLAARLQAALDERVVIERAVGILMSRSGASETETNERLQALSRHSRQKLVVLAQSILDDAVRRARARPTDR